MPILTLKITAPPCDAVLSALCDELTTLTVDTLNKRHELTAVVIDVLPATCWTIGGRSVQRTTALLEINITAGTNTPAQKAAFIAAASAALQHHLARDGALEEASYVIVREVPGCDWGYSGVTQAARQAARIAA